MYAAGQLPYAARKQLVLCLTDFGCFIKHQNQKVEFARDQAINIFIARIHSMI